MALYPVGESSYGALRGVTQYVTNAESAQQVNSLIYESRSVFAGGAVLSVNEGVRSRARQDLLYGAYRSYKSGGPWAALAAFPYSSTHDESRGSALDFGVTLPDGSNRALTMSEHTWLVGRGRMRGVIWTGGDPSFMLPAELWHFNAYPERATLPTIDPEEFDMTPDEKKKLDAVLDAVNKTKTAQGRIERRQVVMVDLLKAIKDATDKTKVAAGAIRVAVDALVKKLTK